MRTPFVRALTYLTVLAALSKGTSNAAGFGSVSLDTLDIVPEGSAQPPILSPVVMPSPPLWSRLRVAISQIDSTTRSALADTGATGWLTSDLKPNQLNVRLDHSFKKFKVTAQFPFDLSKLAAGDSVHARISYWKRISMGGPDRTFSLRATENDDRVEFLQRQGFGPLRIRLAHHGLKGVVVRQGHSAEAFARPSEGFSYALPVFVETPGRVTTQLWQGQRLLLSRPGGGVAELAVLVSQVDRPTAATMRVWERAPYTLRLLVLKQD